MTRKDDRTVKIVATRGVDLNWSVNEVCRAIHRKFFCGKINKINIPSKNGVKIIVDGPQYGGDDRGPGGSDLVTSGGCPPQKQDNIGEWHFAFSPWTFRETATALKSLKNCNKATAKKIFDTTGGSIRLALQCCANAVLDEQQLAIIQRWMNDIVDKQASKPKIDMAYYSTELTADRNSMDRLRTMVITEKTSSVSPPWFKVMLFLASPYVASLLQSKLTLQNMLNTLNFARNSGIGSLYGWHF
uniref:Uncharacterized protein n=1 Tax=Amphora coffeiformis TaxID=265554 RepID=A0A7S3P941_9STRA